MSGGQTLGVVILSMWLMSGCGATMLNTQVKQTKNSDQYRPDPADQPLGIRYRGVTPFEVRIFAISGDKPENSRVKELTPQILYLPDPRHLYEINYQGALFRSHSFTTTFAENGTLTQASLEAIGEPQGAAAGTAVGEIIKSVREAEETKKKASSKKEVLQRELDLLELQLKINETRAKLGEGQ
jgi:hypothetical protein